MTPTRPIRNKFQFRSDIVSLAHTEKYEAIFWNGKNFLWQREINPSRGAENSNRANIIINLMIYAFYPSTGSARGIESDPRVGRGWVAEVRSNDDDFLRKQT